MPEKKREDLPTNFNGFWPRRRAEVIAQSGTHHAAIHTALPPRAHHTPATLRGAHQPLQPAQHISSRPSPLTADTRRHPPSSTLVTPRRLHRNAHHPPTTTHSNPTPPRRRPSATAACPTLAGRRPTPSAPPKEPPTSRPNTTRHPHPLPPLPLPALLSTPTPTTTTRRPRPPTFLPRPGLSRRHDWRAWTSSGTGTATAASTTTTPQLALLAGPRDGPRGTTAT